MVTRTLPPDMVLAYKRYKQDTEAVAGWLAEKSAKAGFKANTDTATIIAKEPKLKGRARKLARDAAKQAPAQPKQKYAYVVKTSEIVDMAKHIAKVNPKIMLRQTMKVIWERAIKMRRQCGDWFKTRADNDVLADERHSHFACVLEEALSALKPCYESVVKKDASPPPKKDDKMATPLEVINNMFAHLEIEDTLPEEELEQETTTSGVALPGKLDTPRAHIEFDDKEAEGEFFFAIWSFMQDLLALRVHVATNWHLYSLGKLELIQAASITNLAVDLVRRAEADFEAILQRPRKYPVARYPTGSLPFLIFKLHLPYQNGGTLDFNPDEPQVIIICGCPTCDFLLYVPWAMARRYVEILIEHPPTFPCTNNNSRVEVPPMPTGRTFKPHLYHAQNPSQKAQTELSEILPTFSMLSLMLRRNFIEDEILHAARHILENHTVPIWVSLALQIQLDIQRLGTLHSIEAFQDLRESFQTTKSRCNEHQKWSDSLGFEIWPKSNDQHVGWVSSQFGDWIEGSKCGRADGEEIRRRVDAGEDYDTAFETAKRVPLLEYFPVTCGTMKTEIQLEFHLLGLRLVNASGHVVMLCHLYNALRTIDPNTRAWPDMELLIRNQGENKVFVGGRPETLEDAQKRLYLAMGMSLTSFAKDSKHDRFKSANAKQREFKHSPLAQNLLDRWLGHETRKVDEAAYELQQLLFNKEYQRRLKEDMYSITAYEMDQLFPRLVPTSTRMVQTLSKLSHAFNAEMPAIAFDYFSFQRRCFEMFVGLNKDARAKLQINDGEIGKKESRRNGPTSITLVIFNSAVSMEGAIRAMTSNDRAPQKAVAKELAKHVQALSKWATDERSENFVTNAVKLIREGRQGDLVNEIMDTTENAAALNIFEPVKSALSKVLGEGKGDEQIRKLAKVAAKATYGVSFFQHESLDMLYGAGNGDLWKDISVAADKIKQATLCTADNPFHYIRVMSYLHQQKVMCGRGKDSHAASGRKSTKVPRPTDEPDNSDDSESSEPDDDVSFGPAPGDGIPAPVEIRPFLGAIMHMMAGAGEVGDLFGVLSHLMGGGSARRVTEGSSNNQSGASGVEEPGDDENEDGDGSLDNRAEDGDKDDWDRSGIYGRQGRYAARR